jgi:hypothetical protein
MIPMKRSISSSSGEEVITVAPGPNSISNAPSSHAHTLPHISPRRNEDKDLINGISATRVASIDGRLLLVIPFPPGDARERLLNIFFSRPRPKINLQNASSSAKANFRNDNDNDNGVDIDDDENGRHEGRNHHGTFSKDYTLSHPEITWIHRGQGRYLPSKDVHNPDLSVISSQFDGYVVAGPVANGMSTDLSN